MEQCNDKFKFTGYGIIEKKKWNEIIKQIEMKQQPNPELKNTAIYVGNDAELRKKAIEYYEANGFTKFGNNDKDEDYVFAREDYVMTFAKDEISNFESLTIITLPEPEPKADSIEESLVKFINKTEGRDFPIHELKVSTALDFITNMNQPKQKYPCMMLVSEDGEKWEERTIQGEYNGLFLQSMGIDTFFAWKFAKPLPTTTLTVAELVEFYEKSNNVKVEVK